MGRDTVVDLVWCLVVGWRLGAVIMEVCWRDSLGEEVQEGNIEYSGGTPNKNMG